MASSPSKVWIRRSPTKRGTSYSLRWYEHGRIRQEYVGRNADLAERRRRRKEYELSHTAGDELIEISFDEFVDQHLALSRATKAPSTVVEEERLFRKLAASCSPKKLTDIDTRAVEAYLRHRIAEDRVSPNTYNKELRMLRAAFNAAMKRRHLRANPANEVPFIKAPQKPIRVLDRDELDALLAACGSLDWEVFIYLAASCGLRSSELTNLCWSNLNLDEGLLSVQNTSSWVTKSRKNRVVGITKRGLDMLRRLRARGTGKGRVFVTQDGNPWGNNVRRDFRRIVKEAGIAHCTIHDLRRTFCTEMAMVVPPKDVQQLAGHASLDTTMKYYVANITIERANAAAKKLRL